MKLQPPRIKGRHREADLQIKAFANKFEASLNASLPQLAPEHTGPLHACSESTQSKPLHISRQCVMP